MRSTNWNCCTAREHDFEVSLPSLGARSEDAAREQGQPTVCWHEGTSGDPDEWQEAYSRPAARVANTAGSKVLTEILQTNECDT